VDRALIDRRVIPGLLEILSTERSDDLLSAALIAAGRIDAGETGVHAEALANALREHLKAPSQELSETAILSLGLLGDRGGFDALHSLLDATDEGAKLVGRGKVPTRSRAFAAFALGAMATDQDGVALEQSIALALVQALEEPHTRPDVPVAAAMALGLCDLPLRVTLPPRELLGHDAAEHVVSQNALARWLLSRSEQTVQSGRRASTQEEAFLAVALARQAAGASPELRRAAIEQLSNLVEDARKPSIVRAAGAAALGEIARSEGSEQDDHATAKLIQLTKTGQPMERRFAMIAIARATARPGTGETPTRLGSTGRKALSLLSTRGGATERPWAALALGVHSHALGKAEPDARTTVSSGLADLFRKQTNASVIGAYGTGLALSAREAPDAARERYGKAVFEAYEETNDPTAKGHLAVALGLLNYGPAAADLEQRLSRTRFQHELLWSLAVGLGLMEGQDATPTLLASLKNAQTHWSRAAAAAALGTVGDRRAAVPLLSLGMDRSQPASTRAFAIVGLGILCEERELPWRNPMARAVPYTALTATLLGDARGLFDIL
jgi:hypothetical protein